MFSQFKPCHFHTQYIFSLVAQFSCILKPERSHFKALWNHSGMWNGTIQPLNLTLAVKWPHISSFDFKILKLTNHLYMCCFYLTLYFAVFYFLVGFIRIAAMVQGDSILCKNSKLSMIEWCWYLFDWIWSFRGYWHLYFIRAAIIYVWARCKKIFVWLEYLFGYQRHSHPWAFYLAKIA